MRLKILTILVLLSLYSIALTPLLKAQTPAQSIDAVHVAFWPDFDDPSVLILITGSLPANSAFPAEVTIPMPENARVNAVARMNSEVGMADISYEINGDNLTLTTPDPQFRVEYYVPYVEEDGWRAYDFNWQADIDVQEISVEVQQPASAITLLTDPPAINSVTNPSDGLIYHGFAPQAVTGGAPYELGFRYNVSDSSLSAAGQAPVQEPIVSTPVSSNSQSAGINWVYVLTGLVLLLLVAVITWFIATRYSSNSSSGKARKSQKPRKPSPRVRNDDIPTRFCHQCGTAAEKDDIFCRKCGTALK